MECGQHISENSSKAKMTLGFLRKTGFLQIRTLVRPKIEYATTIWSLYSKTQINLTKWKKKFRGRQPIGLAGN